MYLSWKDPIATATINALAVAELLAEAWALQERDGKPVTVVQASSGELFGNAGKDTPNGIDGDPTDVSVRRGQSVCASPCGRVSGARSSCLFRDLYNHESPIRPETFVTRKITAGVARIAAGIQDVIELGTLDVRRDWGWAPDYARALHMIARAEPDDFIVATGETHGIEDFLAVAFARVGIESWRERVRVSNAFARPVDPAQQVGDASKARDVLGWRPTKTFEEIVHAMVDNDVALVAQSAAQ